MAIFLAAIFLYLTHSFNLFRTHVVLACLCLAYVTYYNIPPVSLQGVDEALSQHKEMKRK
ncbi:hypothetical protein SLEP1_g16891 [Rubroshorea leprosula]|uniref:Uncharacterized protein n=1 Tax=Rubroshorea leprosula TaxID=152421 RepID=A0AAV5J2V5_9ROSI|nr:hypothetical protein SLEP1_g16891 [Rubroshorea leprosula]